MFCDNESVAKLVSRAESTLKKKHNFICWHAVREAIARGWLCVLKERSETNLSHLLTEALSVPKRKNLLDLIFSIEDPGEVEKGMNEIPSWTKPLNKESSRGELGNSRGLPQ